MDLLIVEPLEAEVLQWLDARHELFYAPRLPQDRRVFQDALNEARAVLVPPQVSVDGRTLSLAPRLRAIGRIVGGPENIDLAACTRQGVEVVRPIDAAAPAEAEFMLGAVLAMLRPSPDEVGRVAGRELGACTLGLVGMTSSARALARLVQPFGTRIVGYDPTLHASDAQWSRWGVQPVSLRELFESADVVTVQMAYYNRYRGLLGERALSYCKAGQVLVSVAPLALFNEEVLAEVLRTGRMTAAWLDSVGPGPLEPGEPLHGVRGLLVTPRLAAYTREARIRSAWGVARRIDEVLRTTPSTARFPVRRRTTSPSPVVPTPDEVAATHQPSRANTVRLSPTPAPGFGQAPTPAATTPADAPSAAFRDTDPARNDAPV